jgi:hypothetical protein
MRNDRERSGEVDAMKRINLNVSIWLAILAFLIAQAALARRPLAGKSLQSAEKPAAAPKDEVSPKSETDSSRLELSTKSEIESKRKAIASIKNHVLRAAQTAKPDRPQRNLAKPAAPAFQAAPAIKPEPPIKPELANKSDRAIDVSGSVQDVLLKPTRLPFVAETSLADVAEYLRKTYRIRVVVDAAALKRTKAKLDDKVQLELDGVRLKTGLKLLLDQIGLTYRVVAEDNLLIITDSTGADDRVGRIWTELKALHRDVHDLQNAVDDLRELQGLIDGDGQLRKPTIIEEAPDELKDKPATIDPKSRPGM